MSTVIDRFGRTFEVTASATETVVSGASLLLRLPRAMDDAEVLAHVESMPPPGDHRSAGEIEAAARAAMKPVSAHRLLIALEAAGLLDAIESFVQTQPRAVQLAWQRTPEFHRNDPMLTAGATAMGLGEAQIDALFRSAGAE